MKSSPEFEQNLLFQLFQIFKNLVETDLRTGFLKTVETIEKNHYLKLFDCAFYIERAFSSWFLKNEERPSKNIKKHAVNPVIEVLQSALQKLPKHHEVFQYFDLDMSGEQSVIVSRETLLELGDNT